MSEENYQLIEEKDFEIECIGEQEEWVFDLEVEDNHNFFGNDILLHNSVYVVGKSKSKLGLISEGRKLIDMINNLYKTIAKNHNAKICTLQMEFEKIFEKVLFVSKRGADGETTGAKKRYAYINLWEDGKFINERKVKYTGLDNVRSDTPRIAKIVQKAVIEMILDDVSERDVKDFISDIDNKIRKGEITHEEIGFPKGITENLTNYKSKGPVIKGALYSNKYLGTRFSKGDKPKFLYIKNVPKGYPDTDVLTFEDELPEGFVPDYDKVNKRIFEMKLKSIFEVMGWKWENPDKNIVTLEAWS